MIFPLTFYILFGPQSGLHFYQCHRCGKGFVHKSSFEMHLMAHDDIRKKQCPHCTQMFRSTSHLNRHLRIHVSGAILSLPESVTILFWFFFHFRLVRSHIRVLFAAKNLPNAIIWMYIWNCTIPTPIDKSRIKHTFVNFVILHSPGNQNSKNI